jgi:hypothetical protein
MFLDAPADKLGRCDFPAEFSHPGEVARPEDFTFRPRRPDTQAVAVAATVALP